MVGLWSWLSAGVGAGCAPQGAVANRTVEVDRVEGEVATVIDRASGEVLDVPRSSLPKGAAEGNVVVDGRLDPALASQLHAEVKDARAALRRSRARSLGEDAAEPEAAPEPKAAGDAAR